jgi:hypothetical protein
VNGTSHRPDGGAAGRRAAERFKARQRMAASDPSESTKRMFQRIHGDAKPAQTASAGLAEPPNTRRP